ncbi:hypothetical protein CYMTET_52687 [Cymbomonas tetramitiformis]|uniref:Uncharacterized protein n=1 Tax=Cymbomonas tetramitiformis TaxID=36881 RepID=A0AAE0EQU1_9CHLO|nr:hypothetical protein CYMTET_52687 [Cymbomonas tetramitiformis]
MTWAKLHMDSSPMIWAELHMDSSPMTWAKLHMDSSYDMSKAAHGFLPYDMGKAAHGFLPNDMGKAAHGFLPYDMGKAAHGFLPYDMSKAAHGFLPYDMGKAAHKFLPYDMRVLKQGSEGFLIGRVSNALEVERSRAGGWLDSWVHMWKREMTMFPAIIRGLLPHLGSPEGTDAESLDVPEEAPRRVSQKELTICQYGPDWLRLFDAANSSVRARLLSLSRDASTWHLAYGGGLLPIAHRLCGLFVLAARVKISLVRELSESLHRLAPFAVEAFGGLGEQAKKFLEECASKGEAFGLHSWALADFPQ